MWEYTRECFFWTNEVPAFYTIIFLYRIATLSPAKTFVHIFSEDLDTANKLRTVSLLQIDLIFVPNNKMSPDKTTKNMYSKLLWKKERENYFCSNQYCQRACAQRTGVAFPSAFPAILFFFCPPSISVALMDFYLYLILFKYQHTHMTPIVKRNFKMYLRLTFLSIISGPSELWCRFDGWITLTNNTRIYYVSALLTISAIRTVVSRFKRWILAWIVFWKKNDDVQHAEDVFRCCCC